MKTTGRNNTVILACSAMLLHVNAAQEKMGTDFEVVELNRDLHEKLEKMRDHIMQTLDALPPGFETVLVAMGHCGGSWNRVPASRRIVIPKMDDCITMLLHTDDTPHANLKRMRHLYFHDCDTGPYSIESWKEKVCREYDEETGAFIFESMFGAYTNVDIIDTGAYDCYSEEFVAEARKNAGLIQCELGYVPGSNLILEKLVSGQWDAQFLVVEAGQTVAEMSFDLYTNIIFISAVR